MDRSAFGWTGGEAFLPEPDLAGHFTGSGRTGGLASVECGLEFEQGRDIGPEGGIKGLEFGDRELVEWLAPFFGEGDHGTDDVMGLAEGHAFADEVIGEVGGEQQRIRGGGPAGIGTGGGMVEHGGSETHAGADGVGGVEHPLFVLLKIPVVGHGQPLQQGQQGHQVADDPG